MAVYVNEIYDEEKFKTDYPQIYQSMKDLINEQDDFSCYCFSQYIVSDHDSSVVYHRIGSDDDVSAYAEFKLDGTLVTFEISED